MKTPLEKLHEKKKFNIYACVLGCIQHYNDEKYWKMREEVVNPKSKKCTLVRLWYLYRIKRSDAFNNASMGTNLNSGAYFLPSPICPTTLTESSFLITPK